MRRILITGGNSGIGFAAAAQLASRGFAVTLLCRRKQAAADACAQITAQTDNPHVDYLIADLSDMAAIRAAVNTYLETHDRLDVLINNAADFDLSIKRPIITGDGMEKQFAVNVAAPFLLMEMLFPLLKKSKGRIINISSQGLCVYPFMKLDFSNLKGEKRYHPARTYYQNKLALLMLSLRMSSVQQNVRVQAIRVTNVRIDMSRYNHLHPLLKQMYAIKSKFSISPDKMAQTYTALATANCFSGFLFDEKLREVRANRAAYDKEAQNRLHALLKSQLIDGQ